MPLWAFVGPRSEAGSGVAFYTGLTGPGGVVLLVTPRIPGWLPELLG